MNILADFHHAGLLNSLIILFEDRLGGKVYRPIGREWFNQSFWKVYDHPATIAQFLDIGGANPDGTDPVNEVVGNEGYGVYKCFDIDSHFTNRAITLEAFFAIPFDIVIATIPAHIEPFKKLSERHYTHPKVIFQIGNAWTTEAGLAPNIMASALINGVPPDINFISYHQEFDLDEFCYTPPVDTKNIFSFINCFNIQEHFIKDWELFRKVEELMPDWVFRSYGGQCRDGAMHGSRSVAQAMKDSRFVWHTKNGGDGYGHIIHNAPAVGRPLIVNRSYYQGKMAEPLLIDGETCIVIDNLNPQEIVSKIMYFNEKERYEKMAKNCYENFLKVVDFDKEELLIREFLSKLK